MKHLLLALLLVTTSCFAKEIQWQGHTWAVVEGSHMLPGPNDWSANNVWIDDQGALNLRVDDNGSAMVICRDALGFGTYSWDVEAEFSNFDPNIISTVFQYLDKEHDGKHEIDIEIAQWGNPHRERKGYAVYPTQHVPGVVHYYNLSHVPSGKAHTFKYTRAPYTVAFDGWTMTGPLVSNEPMKPRMSLWAYKGHVVTPTVVRIKKFTFTPAQ